MTEAFSDAETDDRRHGEADEFTARVGRNPRAPELPTAQFTRGQKSIALIRRRGSVARFGIRPPVREMSSTQCEHKLDSGYALPLSLVHSRQRSLRQDVSLHRLQKDLPCRR